MASPTDDTTTNAPTPIPDQRVALDDNSSDSDSDCDSTNNNTIGNNNGTDNNDGQPQTSEPIEWLATTRERRSTAGNRMKTLIAREDPDSDLELLFAEDEDDAGFSDDADGEDADDAAAMEESDDEDENNAGVGAGAGAGVGGGEDEDLEGEKELERQAQEKRAAMRKRKAQEAIPARFRKKVRINTSVATMSPPIASPAWTSAAGTSAATPTPMSGLSTPLSAAARSRRKKSERASWLPSPADVPTRASSRKTTRDSTLTLHAALTEREAKRALVASAQKSTQSKSDKPRLTQEDRLREAALTERRNLKSLNRWEEAERVREEERRRRLAALQERKLRGPVVTFWSGTGERPLRVVEVEEKPKKKAKTKAEREAEREKEGREKEAGEKGESKDGDVRQADQGQTGQAISTEDKNGDKDGDKNEDMNKDVAEAAKPTVDADPDVEMTSPIDEAGTTSSGPPVPKEEATTLPPALPSTLPSTQSPPPPPPSPPSRPPTTPSPHLEPRLVPLGTATTSSNVAPSTPVAQLASPAPSVSQPDPSHNLMKPPPAPQPRAPPTSPAQSPMERFMRPPSCHPPQAQDRQQTSPTQADVTMGKLRPPPVGPSPPSATLGALGLETAPANTVPALPPTSPVTAPPTTTGPPRLATGPRFAVKIAPCPNTDTAKDSPLPTPTSAAPTSLPAAKKPQDTPVEEPPIDPSAPKALSTRNAIILQNFSASALEDKHVWNQILFDRKMPKAVVKSARASKISTTPMCVISNRPAHYRDPHTGLPYADMAAYRSLQRIIRGEVRWSGVLDAWVGEEPAPGSLPAWYWADPGPEEDNKENKEVDVKLEMAATGTAKAPQAQMQVLVPTQQIQTKTTTGQMGPPLSNTTSPAPSA